MDLDKKLTHVAVVGAAGKMGSGITLLLAQEMARLSLLPENRERLFRLDAVDLDPVALRGLQDYVRAQAVKTAEKTAVGLRDLYADRPDLVENEQIIRDYVDRVCSIVWPTTEMAACRGAELVFEAIVEKVEIKAKVFSQLKDLCPDAFFFTNTSSVPIGLIDEQAELGGRVIGFHFYNPPPVQKLVEIIRAGSTLDEVAEVAEAVGKRLRKTLIPSHDVAGFIGNGHFIRDGLHGLAEARRLAGEHGWVEAVTMVNRVSQDWLLRPMGIFQLIDYVGIDVFRFIEEVMDRHLDEDLLDPTIERMISLGVLGGQYPNGAQKPGFFEYEKGKITAVYDPEKKQYRPLEPEGWTAKVDAALGPLPEGFRPWKALLRAPDRKAALEAHFAAIASQDTLGAKLARAYVQRSREIGQALVDDGVAFDAEGVNGVLTSGFFHLYGPINDYCK